VAADALAATRAGNRLAARAVRIAWWTLAVAVVALLVALFK